MPLHLTPTALAKAKALGVVAAALTAGGAGGVIALSQVSDSAPTTVVSSSGATTAPTTQPTDSATATPTGTESASAAAVPSATSYSLPPCPADVKNHGAYVSGVAHDAPKGKDGHHGQWVSQAAKSDCGKSAQPTDQPDSSQTDSPDSPDSSSPEPVHTRTTEAPKHTDKHGSGHGH